MIATAGMTTPAVSTAPNTFVASVDLDGCIQAMVERHGDGERARIARGVRQVAERWLVVDGDAAAFRSFCVEHFVLEGDDLRRLVDRLETLNELVGGHLYEMQRRLRRWSDLVGDDLPQIDGLLATFNPAPDLADQLYRQKPAFVALLNLRRLSLAEMLAEGSSWTTDDWAQARLAKAPGARIPADLDERRRQVSHQASTFVDGFHVPVGRMVDAKGKAWFEPGRKLIAHWLIREQIKAGYAQEGGLDLQRALSWVMARHIDGSVPRDLLEGRAEDEAWDPQANTLDGRAVADADQVGPLRYEHLLAHLAVAREVDAYHPDHPTALDRAFNLHREIPESDVEAQLVALLEAPERDALTDLLRRRLGRDLEAFDIYFEDLLPALPQEDLNARLRERFPDHRAFQDGLPALLRDLGFGAADADFLGTRIQVEIAKGAGHAMPPSLPEYKAWLRTNSLERELGWDGFDIAMHELGHNLEQLYGHHFVARPALRGVPNNACTEAFAFLYQGLGRQVLGLAAGPGDPDPFDLAAVQSALAACQIAGPALLELHAWRWMYQHPDAGPHELRAEVLRLAEELWSRYYARHYGADPYHILAAYQHMVGYPLYLPDYALGHVISHQIGSHLRGRDLATETRRICSIGNLTPAAWMRQAVGQDISVAPLMRDAADAARRLA
ncbi:MAG: hypothetical protein ACH37Z_04630 [Anaerolineae bacterium]